MFPVKKFVQGPSLHEVVINYKGFTEPEQRPGLLTGDEASKAYEEIINLPPNVEERGPLLTSALATSGKIHDERHSNDHIPPCLPKLSVLFSFCEKNNHDELKKVLGQHKGLININAKDEYDWTLLMSASCAGSANCVSLLLKSGADWKIRDRKGRSAFCLAEKNHHVAVTDLLQKWNQCLRADRGGCSKSNLTDQNANRNGDTTASTATQYCDACKFNYGSSTNLHKNSIAHLVSTTPFGNDKTHYGIPESNRGFQLMIKSGWDKNNGLGPDGKGHKFPVKTVLKRNKLGLGNAKERKAARITHFGPFDPSAVEEPERLERDTTVHKRKSLKQRSKERRKEINFRREFSAL